MAILDILYLALAIAVYPGFRCLVCAKEFLEMSHWTIFDTFTVTVYPHHGEPWHEVTSFWPHLMLKTIEIIWQVLDILLVSTELVLNLSPYAHTVLWIFPVSHDSPANDYSEYASRVVLF